MAEDETLSFSAANELTITVADGGSVQLTVDGRDLGAPGEPGSSGPDLLVRRRRTQRDADRRPVGERFRDDVVAGAPAGEPMSTTVRAELVGVGTELLLGQIANTNAKWMGERLAEIGVDVLYHQVVGDNADRIESVLRLACERADVVLVTGGLGPTEDDITRDVLAVAHGCRDGSPPRDRDLPAGSRFAGFGSGEMPENNLRQADVPRGRPVHHARAGDGARA